MLTAPPTPEPHDARQRRQQGTSASARVAHPWCNLRLDMRPGDNLHSSNLLHSRAAPAKLTTSMRRPWRRRSRRSGRTSVTCSMHNKEKTRAQPLHVIEKRAGSTTSATDLIRMSPRRILPALCRTTLAARLSLQCSGRSDGLRHVRSSQVCQTSTMVSSTLQSFSEYTPLTCMQQVDMMRKFSPTTSLWL